MEQLVPIALYGWIPLSAMLFWLVPARRAAIASMLGGWALLPIAPFPPGLIDQPWGDAFLSTAYPSRFFLTKASAIGAALLVGIVLRDGKALLALRPRWFDVPLMVWCVCPIASALRNGLPITEGLVDAAYLALAWGGPYLAGRMYFADAAGLRDFANGVIIAGLSYVPLCVVETFTKPIFYGSLYGSNLSQSHHPWEMEGAERWIGWRPLGFLEHGNQLGIWLGGAALVSLWMWRAKAKPVLGGWGAAVLVSTTLLSQSAGPIVLVVAALIGQWLLPRLSPRGRWMAGVCAGVAVVALGLALTVGAAPIRSAADSVLGEQGVEQLRQVTRLKSLGSRWSMAAESADAFIERPVVGWGRWDWFKNFGRPPWSLALLAVGMGGVIALAACMGCLLVPVTLFVRQFGPAVWHQSVLAAPAALAALIAVTVIDMLLNPTFNLFTLAVAAGLAAGSAKSSQST